MAKERIVVTVVLGFEFADRAHASDFAEAMKDFGIRNTPPWSKVILSYAYLGSPFGPLGELPIVEDVSS